MKRLLIVGAGGSGREVLQLAKQVQQERKEWDFIGFLDDNPAVLDQFNLGYHVIGSIRDYQPQKDDYLICAIGEPHIKLPLCNLLREKGAQFATLIHPTAIIADDSRIGAGVIISSLSKLSDNTVVGDFVTVSSFTMVGHDVVVGNGCFIAGHCNLMGNVQLADGVFVGGGVQILPGVRVGANAVIGAGSVVVRNVRPGITVFGNPAKQIV